MSELDVDLDSAALSECLALLDRQFDNLTAEARRVSDMYVAESDKVLLPVVISVSTDKRYRSTTIRWCKAEHVWPNGKRRVALTPLRKGRETHGYPASAFSFLEPELRARVLHFEEILTLLRYSLARNRLCHTQIASTQRAVEKSHLQSGNDSPPD